MAVNFKKVSREGAIGHFQVKYFDAWKEACGESSIEMIIDELRRSSRDFYTAKEILEIEKNGWEEVVRLARFDAHAAGLVAVDLGEVAFDRKVKACCKYICGTAYMSKEDYRNVFLPKKTGGGKVVMLDEVKMADASVLEAIF